MSLVALIVAIICFVIAAVIDFGLLDVHGEHVLGWIAFGLVAFAVAHLPLPRYFRR